MGINKRTKHFLGIAPTMGGRQRGQILVLVALAMVGMLVATGLAVDAGVLMMRKSQFDRALDAAALAGAPVARVDNLGPANTRGMQLLSANGIVIADRVDCDDGVLPAPNPPAVPINYYCGQYSVGTFPGSIRYRAVARWNVPLFFMPLIQINNVPLTSDATAEYLSLVDVYASDTGNAGLVQKSNLAFHGPNNTPDPGDPYMPPFWDVAQTDPNPIYGELNGAYTYRITVPPDYETQGFTKVRVELFDASGGNANFYTDTVYRYDTDPITGTTKSCSGGSGDQQGPCVLKTGAPDNDIWFMRIDENRPAGGGGSSSYVPTRNTRTMYRLYYYRQAADGSLAQVDLAYYMGKKDDAANNSAAVQTEALATDLTWVSPGAPPAERMPAFNNILGIAGFNAPAEPLTTIEPCPGCVESNGDFIINLDTDPDPETPGIYRDPNTKLRNIFLEVKGIKETNRLWGTSENGYAVWAGPTREQDPVDMTVPAYINARQLYILRKMLPAASGGEDKTYHSAKGIGLFGMGHLQMNSNNSGTNDFPLTFLGAEFAGQNLSIDFFDLDVGIDLPVIFYFEGIPQSDWAVCYGSAGDCSGYADRRAVPTNWGVSKTWSIFKFTVPSEAIGVNFYGHRLMIIYTDGTTDTFHIKVTVEGRPTLIG